MRSSDEPRVCPHCGTQVASTDQRCWQCYRALPELPPPHPVPRQPRRRRRLPATPFVAAAVALVLGAYCWHVRSSPTTCLMAYLRAEQSGDVRTAYRLLSIRSREMINPEDLANATESMRRESGAMPVYVVRSLKYETGGVEIALEVGAGAPGTATPAEHICRMYLVREEGAWRVDMVRTSQAQADNVMIGGQGWLRLWNQGPRRR